MTDNDRITLGFVLPWPSADLSPNGRIHWRAKAAAVAAARSMAYALATEQPATDLDGLLELDLVFHLPDRRHCDLDGLVSRCKPYLDGICEALGINDFQFYKITATRRRERVPGGRVTITIGRAA